MSTWLARVAVSGFPHPFAGLEVDHPATPPPRCLGSKGHYTALVALVEKQHVLSDLEREQVSGQVADTW